MRLKIARFISVFICINMISCNITQNKKETEIPIMQNVVTGNSLKKIYFGHQSVGSNIVDGIKNNHKNVQIVNLDKFDASTTSSFLLVHSYVGKNFNPKSKIDDFTNIVIDRVKNEVDAVALKFCYVDINAKTDVNALINYYEQSIMKIRAVLPNIKIIHVTTPLTSDRGIKAQIKKMIKGDDNFKRNEYNQLLKERFKNELIFDLAFIEAQKTDGTFSCHRKNRKQVLTLAPEYTDDGGHLNSVGKKHVSKYFVKFIYDL